MAKVATRVFFAVAALAVAQPVAAKRIVDYSVDEAAVAAWSVEQGVPVAPWPAKTERTFALGLPPTLDHDVVFAGMYCSAWSLNNPISRLIRVGFEHWGNVAPSSLKVLNQSVINIKNASTFMRCVGTGEFKAICLTRVTIDADVAASETAPVRSVHVSVEKAAKASGVCAGLTRGVALISRAAVVELMASVDRESQPAKD